MKVLSNVPTCIIPWTDLISALNGGKIDARHREIAILRQSKNIHCEYATHQHYHLAKANNISDKEIKIILKSNKVTGLSELENLICLLTDEIEHAKKAQENTLDLLNKHLDTQEITLTNTFNIFVLWWM